MHIQLLRVQIMPRKPDINAAFVAAVQLNPKGFQCLRTDDFIRELSQRNWHFSQKDANGWIESYQPDFADRTTDFSENRYWILRNMGRVR
jgi:hypothetical protein